MAKDTPAANVTGQDVYRLPWEGGAETSPEEVAASLADELPSDEDNSDAGEPEPAEEAGEPESEDSDDGEVDGEDEEGDSDEEPDEPSFTVKVDGQDVTVTLSELRAGYSRTADYTRKTQQLAQNRKALETEAAQARQTREAYAHRLAVVEQAIVELTPQEPDWDRLRQENPTEYAVQFAEHQQRRQQLAAVRAEQERLTSQQRADYEQQLAQILEIERQQLVAAIPEWVDEGTAADEKRQLLEYARGMGYSDEDLAQVYDHRVMLILRKAHQWDKLQQQGVSKVREKARSAPAKPTLKPGGAPMPVKNKSRVDAATVARNRLARTGSANDAARLLEMMLDD
jgi:hypothetical protein